MKSVIKLLLIVLLAIFQEVTATSSPHHHCIHDKISKANLPVSPQRKLRSVKHSPIRIVPYFVNEHFKLNQNTQKLIKNHVIKEIRNLICGPNRYTIPKEHEYAIYCTNAFSEDSCSTYANGPGVPNADFVLYVFAVDTTECSGGRTLAYSTSCITNDDGRPIAGFVNFCEKNLGQNPDYYAIKSITTHEILHSLGFSNNFFKHFRNSQGKTYSAVENLKINNKIRPVITSPTALQVARRYFNCPNLQGILLEDEGSSGSAGSHWEMTILKTEIMAPAIDTRRGRDVSISEFTLALLQDSGWYLANFSAISSYKLLWGKGLGCNFVNKPCSNAATYPYLCNPNITKVGCNFDYQAAAACSSSAFSNGCHIMEPAMANDCWQPKTSAKNCGPYYGISSQCFIGTIQDSLHISYNNRPYCFKSQCQINSISGKATLKVIVNICSSYCIKCSDNSSKCQECLPNFYKYNQKCYQQCPMGAFSKLNSYHCQDCNRTRCTSCRNTANYCTACTGPLVANDGTCVNQCPLGRSIPPHSDECTDNGVIIKRSYKILYFSENQVEQSDTSTLKKKFKTLISSQALVASTIELLFVGNDTDTDYFVMEFSLQGSYTQVMTSYTNILLKLNHHKVDLSLPGNHISALNITVIEKIDIISSPSAPIFATSKPATTIPSVSPATTKPQNNNLLSLTLLQWILIGIGSAIAIGISMLMVWCFCSKRPPRPPSRNAELLMNDVEYE
ncbi:Leishmanolysin-like peptidase [Trichoplax sp. H2]|nr:Leishmanolysin-like peptidase [Trichoplax sp. H2]|eukprot:RDD40190.1 Leishmanolysin-like peptidase [Trichoplax sp. H2]